MWKWLILISVLALSFTQVPAGSTKTEVTFIENVKSGDIRIVSGWAAYPGQFPWQLYLRMINPGGTMSACGGSIVHREWFITAAHCTATRSSIIAVGGTVDQANPVYTSETTTWFMYPTYDANQPNVVQPDDIAIVKFREPVAFNHLIHPIRLQSSADAHREYDGDRLIASGYGRTWTDGPTSSVLNWVYLLGVTTQSCQSLYQTIITSTTICARYYNSTSQSTCQGDSGGPLVYVNDEGESILVGVASFVAGGQYGCHSGLPAGFCRVGPFHSWFKAITAIDFDELNNSSEEKSGESSSEESGNGGESNGSGEGGGSDEGDGSGNGSQEGQSGEDNGKDSKEDSGNDSKESGGNSNEIICDKHCSQLLKKLDVKVKVHIKLRQ